MNRAAGGCEHEDVGWTIEQYTKRAAPVRIDDLDLGAFAATPLDGRTLRCLRYMHDVEYHTICYLRELLLTPAHRDPEVTAFLTMWCYEEYWHGAAIAAVLDAHGEGAGLARVGASRARLSWRERARPFLIGLGGSLAGGDFLALHMAWGAVNEWTAQAGYGRLAARAGHPVLAVLLGRIMRQEGRHVDFYARQARERLQASARARRLARCALGRLWHPVGAGVMAPGEVRFVVGHLFGDEEGRRAAARVDERVARLPGLEGLALLARASAALASEPRPALGLAVS